MTNIILSVIAALIMVESQGNPNVKDGDGCDAVGILQEHPIMVEEANRLLGYEMFTLEDRRNPMLARQIAFTVLSRRMERRDAQRPFTSDLERIRYMAGLWNRGEAYKQKVIKEMEKQ